MWTALFLIISLLLGLLARYLRNRLATLFLIHIVAICLAIAGCESYLAYQQAKGDGTRMEGSITEGFTHPDDMLGYAPVANARVIARKFHKNSLIYDVVYTIDPHGLRITPRVERPRKGCVQFFGDSITFGEGVNDEESLPYRVGVKTAGEYAVHNFAFSGYGPHQMLASLQARREEGIVDCASTHFIYLCIPEHTERVAGLAFWDKHGPRFRLTAPGTVVRDGNFDSPRQLFRRWTIPQWIEEALDSFLTWQKLFGRAREATPADLKLLIAIIREAARIAQERYPHSKFHVILWDGNDNERVRSIESGLMANRIPVHRETAAIPDFRANWRQYVLSEYDLHPNPLHHERLADYVVDTILSSKKDRADQGAR